ncbi:hypothetical protein HHL16_19930 [Pseudoflavitalea sp. G-6-1-2]|uniref:hypothetical protein n=1 Tax=Pseudoflavitalea sp. G-6-1-2 TaxID=2728841 RepID=UPI00146B5B41|nr:hypothetical protein [Pseudoflavitalea sp. G-6-1-2]NML23157.1 hypothetical protein [Pseudoflavitalea sp. G-6-1-2]
MKASKQLGLTLCVCLMCFTSFSQDTAAISQRAKFYADSMCRSYFYEGWQAFSDLTMYSAIKYYGGKDAYTSHFKMLYFHNAPDKDVDKPEQTSMITLMNKGTDEWQCVLEKIRFTQIDNRRARIYSYLVGQSKDDGDTWKFVDAGQNSEKNIIYIFPDVFGTLAIPEYRVVYEDEEAAKIAEAERAAAKAAEAAKAKPVKRATPKKK